MPTHAQVLGDGANLTSIAAGSLIFDRDGGSPPTAWSTAFPSVASTVVINKKQAGSNLELTVSLSGYDQFDRLVEEEIAVPSAGGAGMSKHAYSELIQCELVAKGSTHITDLDIGVYGVADHDDLSVDWSGTTLNASCRIGLPFIPTRPEAIRAIHVGLASSNTWMRRLSANTWKVETEASSVGESAVLPDAAVYGGDLGNACILLPHSQKPLLTAW